MKIIRPMTVNDAALTSSNVTEADYAAWSAATVYAIGTRVTVIAADVHKIYESLAGGTSAVTMTIATPCVVSWTAHGQAANTPVQFSTTGALPTGLVAGTVYYVLSPTANSFNVSATPGGAAINTSGSQSGVHTAIASLNYAQTPATSPTYWLDVGSTNRWKMFDASVASQTSNLNSIADVITTSGRVDSVVLLNVSAATVHVTMTDATDGVVYDQTESMISDSGITDWYSWFFEPIERKTDVAFSEMPPYNNAQISITLTDTGATVLCGECILGLSKDIGGTQYGVGVGIQDFSVKTQDDFGNYEIVERAFSNRGTFTIWVDPGYVDALKTLLAGYRATPVVYIGADDYTSTIIYGFYKDFNIEIAYESASLCSLDLEGLT